MSIFVFISGEGLDELWSSVNSFQWSRLDGHCLHVYIAEAGGFM